MNSSFRLVPKVKVFDESGRPVLEGYYSFHRSKSVCFREDDRPEYSHDLIVSDTFSDWGLDQNLKVTEVTSPHTIEVDKREGDDFVLSWLGLDPEKVSVDELKRCLRFVQEQGGFNQLYVDWCSMETCDVLLDHVAEKLGVSVEGRDFEDSIEVIDTAIDVLKEKK